MVYEIAQIDVVSGQTDAFEQGVKAAKPLFEAAVGFRSIVLQKSVELPERYRLVVGWNTVDDHMVTFRGSPAFQRWRELVGPFFASPPHVEHVELVELA